MFQKNQRVYYNLSRMMFYTTYFPIKTSNTINGTIGQVVKLSTQPIQGQC